MSFFILTNVFTVFNFHLKCISHRSRFFVRARITFKVEGTHQQAFFAFLEADQKKIFSKVCSIEYLIVIFSL